MLWEKRLGVAGALKQTSTSLRRRSFLSHRRRPRTGRSFSEALFTLSASALRTRMRTSMVAHWPSDLRLVRHGAPPDCPSSHLHSVEWRDTSHAIPSDHRSMSMYALTVSGYRGWGDCSGQFVNRACRLETEIQMIYIHWARAGLGSSTVANGTARRQSSRGVSMIPYISIYEPTASGLEFIQGGCVA